MLITLDVDQIKFLNGLLDSIKFDKSWYERNDIDKIQAEIDAAQAEPLAVVVSVSGGVAEVENCPDCVDVEIVDYDDIDIKRG